MHRRPPYGKLTCLAICVTVFSGGTCPVPSIGVVCSNALDASMFGFSLVVPPEFVCTTVIPNSALLLSARYRQASTGFVVSVAVAPSADTTIQSGDGITTEDLGAITNSNNVAFQRTKAVIASLNAFSFVGTTVLPSGNTLGITVAGLSDDPALRTAFDAIVESVQLVP